MSDMALKRKNAFGQKEMAWSLVGFRKTTLICRLEDRIAPRDEAMTSRYPDVDFYLGFFESLHHPRVHVQLIPESGDVLALSFGNVYPTCNCEYYTACSLPQGSVSWKLSLHDCS